MSSVMDLNALPLPEDDEEYFEQHSAEDVTPHGHESSVETLHREREERRQRMRSDLVDDRPVRKNRRSLDQDEGPQLKKFKSDRNKLPSGWLDCPNFGQEIAFIIPSKVPLDESFNIPPGKRYSFSRVLERVKNFKVGMVVDLTNTDRYYSTRDFKNKGVKYLKIRCQGRDAVPDNEAVNTFVFEVSQYILNQPKMQPKKHVFVHCTHGHNRTGYMIVNYLMRTQQATSVTEAIRRFSKSRPPGIYKQDYIDSLYAFYHEAKPELVVCPSTPEWKRSADFDLNGEALPEDDDGVSYAPINEKQENIILMTNDDVLGDKIPDDQEVQFRRFCFEMLLLRLPEPTRGKSQFPGSHPVSLDRENLQLLRQRYYYATWKADGTRYMLLLSPDGCYLVDRSFKFRRVQMRFPCKDRVKCHHFTLLDGEMIIDTIGPQKQERRYLIYDLIALNRVSMIEWPFYERWKMIDKEIIEPRYYDRDHPKAPYRYDLEPFRVRRKDFWLLSTARKLLKDLIPKLSHEADGLIFQGWDDPYVPRTHEGLLKWKYPEMNSVDFLFEIREDGAECLYLHEQGKKRLMDNNGVVFGDAFEPASSYSGKIIECSWDSEENVWVCMRVRVDKSTPNDFNTYKKVMKSIKDNITEEVLLNEIDEIISLPMYADRIQIDSRSQKKGKQPPK